MQLLSQYTIIPTTWNNFIMPFLYGSTFSVLVIDLIFPLQIQQLIAELNEILAHDVVDEAGVWKKKLTPQSLELFELLPPAIQEQLMLERDPHGNVQVHLLHHA